MVGAITGQRERKAGKMSDKLQFVVPPSLFDLLDKLKFIEPRFKS